MKRMPESSLRLFTDHSLPLVVDASAIINLNATQLGFEVLTAIPAPFHVTEQVVTELENGRKWGHDDADFLQSLISQRLVSVTPLGGKAAQIYDSLVFGEAIDSLDDGEAATIACAIEQQGVALIDESKAKRICSAQHPGLTLISTVELLLTPRVEASLGKESQKLAVANALQRARMRVPHRCVPFVIDLIGPDQAVLCRSLPWSVREPLLAHIKPGKV